MANDTYPKRESFFALRFCRLMTKRCLAQEAGSLGAWLLTVIVNQEDAVHYRRGVTFYDGQLMPILGINSKKTMTAVRKKLIESGWLHFESGHKGKASTYWVLMPASAQGLDDQPTDEAHDESGSPREPNKVDSVPESGKKGTSKGTHREPKGGLFIPDPIPDPNTQHTPAAEVTEDLEYPLQKGIGDALILSEVVNTRLAAYTPDVRMRAWRIVQLYCKQAGDKRDAAKAKDAATFADACMKHPGAEQILTEYLSVTDPLQIAAEVEAGTRISPGSFPWEIIVKLFGQSERSRYGRSQRSPSSSAGGGRHEGIDAPTI